MKTLRMLSKDKRMPTILGLTLIFGVFLMLLSGPLLRMGSSRDNTQITEMAVQEAAPALEARPPYTPHNSELALERRLEEALSMVAGVGKVRVMLTFSRERETVFAVDRNVSSSVTQEQDAQGGTRYQSNQQSQDNTIIIMDRPLVVTENPPVIGGVMIIAEGGDNVLVRDALIRATSTLLGIDINRVQVLAMK